MEALRYRYLTLLLFLLNSCCRDSANEIIRKKSHRDDDLAAVRQAVVPIPVPRDDVPKLPDVFPDENPPRDHESYVEDGNRYKDRFYELPWIKQGQRDVGRESQDERQTSGSYPVAFTMTKATRNTQCINPSTCFLEFHKEVTKVNANTYPLYGAFVANVPGLYVVNINVRPNGSEESNFSLRRNREVIANINFAIGQLQTESQTAILHLNNEDTVYTVIESGDVSDSANADEALNSFSGFLLEASGSPTSIINAPLAFPGFPNTVNVNPNPLTGNNLQIAGGIPFGSPPRIYNPYSRRKDEDGSIVNISKPSSNLTESDDDYV